MIRPLIALAGTLVLAPSSFAQLSRVETIGDVDLDGKLDVVVADERFTGPAGKDSGRVTCRSATGAVLWTLDGPQPGARLGHALAAVGDLDLDGLPDLAVSQVGAPSLGRVVALSGNGTTLWTVNGPFPPGGFGASVGAAGDLNQDGRPDVAVGAPAAQPPGGGTFGAVTAISGTGHVLWTTFGPAQSKFGHAVTAVGDVDLDGRIDLAVGATGGAGRTYVVDQGSVITWTATGPLEGPGYSVAAAGDVDGDGADDILTGQPHYDVTGFNNEGRAMILSPANNAALATWTGAQIGGHFGLAVAAPGDVDGDGTADHAVGGAVPANNLIEVPGELHVFSGATLATITATFGVEDEQLGTDVSFAGDLDGDGRAEVWAVAPGYDLPDANDVGRAIAVDHTGAVVASVAGDQGPFQRYGDGCVGEIDFDGDPSVGGAFTIYGRGFEPGFGLFPNATNVSLIVGVSDSQYAGVPLPLDLGPLGYAGCDLNASMDGLFPSVYLSASSFPFSLEVPADVSFGIPLNPAYVGVEVHFQWLVDPPGSPTVPVGLTEGLRVTVQP